MQSMLLPHSSLNAMSFSPAIVRCSAHARNLVSRSGDTYRMLRLQGAVAVAVPWTVVHLIALESWLWALLAFCVPLIFAALHLRSWQAWCAPAAGVLSVLPPVSPWASGIATFLVAALLVTNPPADAPLALSGRTQHPVIRWGLGAGLLIVAIGVGAIALIQDRQQADAFNAGQELAAEAWGDSDVNYVGPGTELEPDETTTTTTEVNEPPLLVGEPTIVEPEAAELITPPFATLQFTRPDSDAAPVTDRTLYVGPDVTEQGLKAGPGHYPRTAEPGKKGNVAIAGHRTGWGSPFLELDELQPGDRITLTDREGVEHTYVVDSAVLVEPEANWVLGDDPLGTGEPTLTLTTCDPPGVNTERLIVFATLTDSTST